VASGGGKVKEFWVEKLERAARNGGTSFSGEIAEKKGGYRVLLEKKEEKTKRGGKIERSDPHKKKIKKMSSAQRRLHEGPC